MTAPLNRAAQRRSMLLFGLLTLATFVGPLVIVVVGRGGRRPSFPPDRPLEHLVFWGVTGGYALLMGLCLWETSRSNRRSAGASDSESPSPSASEIGVASDREDGP